MNVILCGYHWAGCKSLQLLLDAGHNVFVYTHESPWHIPSLSAYCRQRNVPHSLEDISTATLPFEPQVICSVYYRHLINKQVIDACSGKIFNLHPSLLPKYRGCSSLTWAMIHGEREVGFTYHYIDEGCDSGPIILQKTLPVEGWDTQETLYLRVMFEAMGYFRQAFDLVGYGVPGRPQVGPTSHYPRSCPHDGQINPSWDDDTKERFIRAMIYPPLPPAKLGDREIRSINELEP